MTPEEQRIGAWLSAALDDPHVCEDMKRDITAWMDACERRPTQPLHALAIAAMHRAEEYANAREDLLDIAARRDAVYAAINRLATAAAAVPEGWKLVPTFPTGAMVEAMRDQNLANVMDNRNAYLAALAAAQEPTP